MLPLLRTGFSQVLTELENLLTGRHLGWLELKFRDGFVLLRIQINNIDMIRRHFITNPYIPATVLGYIPFFEFHNPSKNRI